MSAKQKTISSFFPAIPKSVGGSTTSTSTSSIQSVPNETQPTPKDTEKIITKSNQPESSESLKQLQNQSGNCRESSRSDNTTKDISLNANSKPVQPTLSTFPRRTIGGQNRSFNSKWYLKYSLLEYSVKADMIYCFCCRHYAGDNTNCFITGYCDWKNMASALSSHFCSSNSSHQFAFAKYNQYLASLNSGHVSVLVNSQHKTQVIRNRDILATHIRVLILCGQQDLAIRGHREDDRGENPGNFLAILNLLKLTSPDLARKMDDMPKNAKYTNHDIQNEIIELCGKNIQRQIYCELNETGPFSIIADESKDNAGVEQLSVCVRYVYNKNVQERFIGFTDLHKFDAETIADSIVKLITNLGLDIKECVSQSFDGASVMSGHLNGTFRKIESFVKGPCPYVHCYAHRLNLALVDSCQSIVEVKELLGLLQAIYNFQSNSVKRSEYFTDAQTVLKYETILRIPKSTSTRWSSKSKGVKYFKSRLPSELLALENLVVHGKPDEGPECRGYISQLRNFRTIFTLNALDEILGLTNSLSEYLQQSELLYTRAVTLSEISCQTLVEMRTNECFDRLWTEAEIIAKNVKVASPSLPAIQIASPIPKRKKNVPARLKNSIVLTTTGARSSDVTDPKIEFRRTLFDIIDTFIESLSSRLTANKDIAPGLTAADPTSTTFLNEEYVMSFCEMFSRFSFNLSALKCQIPVARNLIIAEKTTRISKCYSLIYDMRQSFPDLLKYYNLVLCVPVSSASCERSFSSLNRILSYDRTKSGQTRTSNLSLISFERDLSDKLYLNPFVIVDEFAKCSNRRIDLTI